MKPQTISIHFGEIWLKGRNRKMFVDLLLRNIKSALSDERHGRLENERDRFILHLTKGSNAERITDKLSKVFGISWVAPCIKVKSEMKSILDGVVKASGGSPVRVEAHRSTKTTEFTSYEIVSNLLKLARRKKIKMDLESPNLVKVSVKGDFTYISFDRVEGARGLPVGSSGSAVVLLSGGIDSPVSAFYAMKRGLRPIYVHLHGFDSNKAKELSKIKGTIKALSPYSGAVALHLVPAHVFQTYSLSVQRKYELVLFKRFIYRVAERIANAEEADCLVTGESLGQVASQTIKNLEASSAGVKKFILRPLIGMDKQEIIDMAKRIGTFEISTRRYKDVCSIEIAHPELRARRAQIDKLYKESSMAEALEQTIGKSQRVLVRSA
jgi:thiamine biosynthesis protein ThiI